jgi:hypothetical protein
MTASDKRATCFECFSPKLPQNRHPERSASQICRLDPALEGAESKDPGGAYSAHAVRAFSTTEAREQYLPAVRT